MSRASCLLSFHDNSTFLFWRSDQRVPPGQYSRTIAKLGGLVQAPRNITMFGCLRASIAWHSLMKSLTELSFYFSILKSLTATVVFLHLASYMIPYPPSDIWRPSDISWKGISMELSNTRGFNDLENSNLPSFSVWIFAFFLFLLQRSSFRTLFYLYRSLNLTFYWLCSFSSQFIGLQTRQRTKLLLQTTSIFS